MQKKLIAMAVAGLVSGAAFAQSANVTMYGIADVYYGRATASGATAQSVINSGGQSGSRIGFKGTEALGNGISAIFTMEYGVDLDNQTGLQSATSARQQFVGLTGDFGTAVAGRLQTAGYDFACATGPLADSVLDPQDKLGAATVLNCGSKGRANNAFAYITPSFGGFKAAWNHARVTEAVNSFATKKDSYANLLTGVYANGPIAANLTYSKVNVASTAASDDVTELGINGSYDFGAAKLFASYQYNKVGSAAKDNKYNLAVSIPVGSGAIIGQYAWNRIKSTAASDNSKAYMIAYSHSLSKRTNIYTGYTRVNNNSGAAAAAVLTPTLGGSSSVFGLGLRHSF